MEGRFIKPVIGEIYENNGGGTYKCIGYEPDIIQEDICFAY